MRRTAVFSITSLLIVLLTACGSDAPPPADPKPEPTPTFADPLLRQRDRVQERVDQLPAERKGALDQAIESGQE